MLAAEALQTPRPRPPAQMRRSPPGALALNTEGAPPPPYVLEFPSLREGADCDTSDPVLATAKMMGIELDEDPELSPRTIAEVSQKSREELTDLFLQAEKIIRARETELALAANLGKTLLETNEALKLRHDALLSRLPVMQPQAIASPSKAISFKAKRSQDDPWTTDDDVPASALRSRSVSVASSSHSRTNSVAGSLAHRGHGRRISASPSALHALSETNAELIAELTCLRSATDSAQIEGARRLRKLEREIGGLKAELDLSQRLNAELEERVKEQQDDDRKREREERLRKLRAAEALSPQEQESDIEIRDFAPSGLGIETWDPMTTPRMSRRPSSPIDTSMASESEHEDPHSSYEASISSANSSRPGSKYGTISPGEYAVVAQLYRKVEELQEANAELGMRNRIVNERLARAERDALQLKRVYDQIGEEIGAEADVESSECEEGSKGTIRGTPSPARSPRSLRSARSVTPTASLRGRTINDLGEPFSEDTPTSKSRTGTRALGNKYMYKYTRSLKNRKPLTESLFAPPTRDDVRSPTPSIVVVPARSPQSGTIAKEKSVALPFRSPSPFDPSAGQSNPSESSRVSTRSARSVSISSLLTTSSYTSLTRYPGRRRPRRSLGSELGEEFGADWGIGSNTSRRNSLFNDEALVGDNLGCGDDGGEGDGEEDGEHEDPALAALRQALNPPYAGRLLEPDEDILPVGALRVSPGEAFQLVSHAVAVRPNRWFETDGRRRTRGPGPRGVLLNGAFFAPQADAEDPWETTRYPDVEPGADGVHDHSSDRDGHQDHRSSIYVRSCRRERALERLASTRRASQGDGDMLSVSPDGQQTADQQQRHLQLHEPRGPALTVAETIKRTSVDALVEIWIFLQFVVVICTFVYTMTRRGPREILGAPSRRA